MRGRKPIPGKIQELKGSYRENPSRRRQSSDLPASVPDCPQHLNEVARTEWQRITGELVAVGLISQVDRAALSIYCGAWARLVEAEECLKVDGLVIRAATGCPIANPYVAIAAKAAEQIRTIASEFGLTPSSRMRLDLKPPKAAELDEWAQFTDSGRAS